MNNVRVWDDSMDAVGIWDEGTWWGDEMIFHKKYLLHPKTKIYVVPKHKGWWGYKTSAGYEVSFYSFLPPEVDHCFIRKEVESSPEIAIRVTLEQLFHYQRNRGIWPESLQKKLIRRS